MLGTGSAILQKMSQNTPVKIHKNVIATPWGAMTVIFYMLIIIPDTSVFYLFCVLTHRKPLPAQFSTAFIGQKLTIIFRCEPLNDLHHFGDTFFRLNRIGYLGALDGVDHAR